MFNIYINKLLNLILIRYTVEWSSALRFGSLLLYTEYFGGKVLETKSGVIMGVNSRPDFLTTYYIKSILYNISDLNRSLSVLKL